MIELKDLSFIDKIALSILTSRLSSTDGLNLTRDKVESLATSAYRFATVVYDVRESFKKEHNIVECEEKLLVEKKECCCKNEDERKEEKKTKKENKEKTDSVQIDVVPEDPFAEGDQATSAKKEKKALKKSKVSTLEANQDQEQKPSQSRKPKTVLKVNKILNRKN